MFRRFFRQLLSARQAENPPVSAINSDAALESIRAGQLAEREGRLAEALGYYQTGLQQFPDSAGLNHACGNVLRALGRDADAAAAYRKTVALKPGNADAWNNLGVALCALSLDQDAEPCFQRAIGINPVHAEAFENLGGVYHGQGRLSDALANYRELLRLKPDSGNARHMVAALSGLPSDRAPVEYVLKVFDGYADIFDSHLVEGLKYTVPAELTALLVAQPGFAATKRDLLDLGCGTGLVGVEIAGYARQLVGVDLSPQMLAKARAKNVYTRLEHADLLAMTRCEADASYDALMAADVFIYLGKIDEIVAEARRLLRAPGWLAFSVEALAGTDEVGAGSVGHRDYRVLPSGRYAQSSAYLERLAAQHGFTVRAFNAASIREEKRAPVAGWLLLWEKTVQG
jgi:predicted TPR repeat methyltransferase